MTYAICVPIARAPAPDHYTSMLRLQAYAFARNIPISLVTASHHANTPRIRNILAARALADPDTQALVWIDDDIGFEPEDFERLLRPDVTICAGLYARRDENHASPFAGQYAPESYDPAKGLYRGAPGHGFIRVDRCVYESAWGFFHHPSLTKQESAIARMWYRYAETQTGELLGEDHVFTQSANFLGHPVWIDPAIKLRHWGSKAYTAEFPPPPEAVRVTDDHQSQPEDA